MFRKLIKDIKRAVKINHRAVNDGNVQCSSFAAGMAKGYIDVLRSMGHKATGNLWDDNGCDGISYMEIDGVILVYGGEIDRDGYAKLMKKQGRNRPGRDVAENRPTRSAAGLTAKKLQGGNNMNEKNAKFYWFTFADGYRVCVRGFSAQECMVEEARHGKMISKTQA